MLTIVFWHMQATTGLILISVASKMPSKCSAASQAALVLITHSKIAQLPLTMLMQEKNHSQSYQKDMR